MIEIAVTIAVSMHLIIAYVDWTMQMVFVPLEDDGYNYFDNEL